MLVRVVLLLVLVILLVRFLVRLVSLAAAALRGGAAPPVRPQAPAPAVALVPCRRCGVFFPNALASSGPGDGFLCRSCAAA